jgi:hypothetical protein
MKGSNGHGSSGQHCHSLICLWKKRWRATALQDAVRKYDDFRNTQGVLDCASPLALCKQMKRPRNIRMYFCVPKKELLYIQVSLKNNPLALFIRWQASSFIRQPWLLRVALCKLRFNFYCRTAHPQLMSAPLAGRCASQRNI